MMLRIGLTGGIASGKSTAERCFRELGVPVLDADQVARDVVEPGAPALDEIADAFGPGILTTDGRLDRAALRHIVFNDANARRRLEAITHPRIFAAIEAWFESQSAPYSVLSAALMVGGGSQKLVDRIVVVDAPVELQRARLIERDGASEELADRMIASQSSRESRLAAAHDVLLNHGDPDQLREQIRALHQRLSELAQAAGTSSGKRLDPLQS